MAGVTLPWCCRGSPTSITLPHPICASVTRTDPMEVEAGSSPSDEELMSRLKGGEDAALAQLMRHWELPVKRFLFRIVGNAAEAEDLAQEVFVRIYTKRATYRKG